MPRAAYVHVPFCRRRCGYCNFTVVAGRDDLIEAYLRAIAVELSWLGTPREIDSLFLGGGTPSHLRGARLEQLLQLLLRWFVPNGKTEFTLEANPTDLTAEQTAVLAEFGVNRISLGVQSFQERKLAFLERDHRQAEIERAVTNARRSAGNLALDLIFGVPGETLAEWRDDLRRALDCGPQHLSVYGLTFERGARFYGRLLRGDIQPVAEESERAMYETAIEVLTAAGLEHYEVSNFALPGRRCRHNEVYWTGGSYDAIGPGAARYVGGRRETNHRGVKTYLRRVLAGQSPVAESEMLAPEDAARERLVFALRRLEGVAKTAFAAETGYTVEELGGDALSRFVDWGLLEVTPDRLRLTRRGLLISDAMWPKLLRA